MEYKITAPNKEYNGVSAGVPFVNGEATTEDENAVAWFKSKGYTVELTAGQPFVVGNQKLGKVEDEYIIVTDVDAIAETLEAAECIEATISEIKTMKADKLVATAAELGIDLTECKKVDEKRDTIISAIKAKNAEQKVENMEVSKQENDTAQVEDVETSQRETDTDQAGADEG